MMLRLRFRLPVFPIVIYLSPGAGGLTTESHKEDVFGREVLRFTYASVGLPDLSADDYQSGVNPLGASLSAFMKASRQGRAAQKFQSLQQIAISDLDDARKWLLAHVIQTFLKMNTVESQQFDSLLAQQATREVREMVHTYTGVQRLIFEEAIEQGLEQGIEEGILRGKRETLLKLMSSKFGALPENIVAKIESLTSEAVLDTLLERILSTNSLEDMGLPGD